MLAKAAAMILSGMVASRSQLLACNFQAVDLLGCACFAQQNSRFPMHGWQRTCELIIIPSHEMASGKNDSRKIFLIGLQDVLAHSPKSFRSTRTRVCWELFLKVQLCPPATLNLKP